ncbi:MAG: phosphoribosylamine--glycine ligase [bacterium]
MGDKVLIVGSGGREHCLGWKIAQSPKVSEIISAPGNAGLSWIGECVPIRVDEIKSIAKLAENRGVDLTIVGPEEPLALGIVDEFEKRGLPIFGPTRKASMLEASKVFAKDIMNRVGVPTAEYKVFSDYDEAISYIENKSVPFIIKADGLAFGKGVTVAIEKDKAYYAIEANLKRNIFGKASKRIVIEEYLCGEEASVLAFTDGETIIPMISAQDYKRIYDGDEGPNTGGMGSYAPAPILPYEYLDIIVDKIYKPILEGLKKEGIVYKGVLYSGLMIGFDGPKVLEFNVRFGDPETQAILPLLKNDFYDILKATIEGRLKDVKLEWESGVSLCVVVASGGYPDKYSTGMVVKGLESLLNRDDIYIFIAGARYENGKLETSGGRVMGITAKGRNIFEAKKKAYDAVSSIDFDGIYFRKDIGYKAIERYL